ncbi:hypothetical protein QCA50_002724 [Cerrena zonata]|uniref:Carrier domain-containing protein n=1 Tax=Cerrena zonata TaxID=2478898 RepID=A0AAW0GIJ4_9APHY
MEQVKEIPPRDGSIPVMPGFIDFQAQHHPDHPWFIFPSKSDPQNTTSITFAEFAMATHRIAHFIRPERLGSDDEVVVILVNCDIVLYVALLGGIIRAGLVPFPVSPRNSPEAICAMLQKVNCHRIITQPSVASVISAVNTQMANLDYELQVDDLLPLSKAFPMFASEGPKNNYVAPYPPSTRPINPDRVVIYIHSSGSTGFPKPIPQTEKINLQWCKTSHVEAHIEHQLRSAGMLLPTFHLMGTLAQLYYPAATGLPVAVFTPQEPLPPHIPNPQNILEVVKVAKCTALSTVPTFLEQWVQSPEAIEVLKTMKLVRYAGGPLSVRTGDQLVAAGVHLASSFGGTEFGAPTAIMDIDYSLPPDAPVRTRNDWAWVQFIDKVKIRWIDQGDGTYELQFLTCDTHQPAVENLPDVRGYATNDLFEPHPWKTGLWRPVARLDDVIVLGTGEKVVPLQQEAHITSVPYVTGAVIFGRGKTQCGVLIELSERSAFDPSDQSLLIAFRNKIWPHVEEANKLAPQFARIFKEMILVTDPTKPMTRSGKGTAQRRMVLNAYADEIEKLYQLVESSSSLKNIASPVFWDAFEIEAWLCELVASIHAERRLKPNQDFFEQGLDSLSATYLRNRIMTTLRLSSAVHIKEAASQISQDFVYSHPTIRLLARGIRHLLQHPGNSERQQKSLIHSLIDKYTPRLPDVESTALAVDTPVVVLTGSTGHLGCQILASLLSQQKVTRVYTFNRGEEVSKRQKISFKAVGLPLTLLEDPRLVQLQCELGAEGLGLSGELLQEVRSTATHIIHNAWKVDFNLSLLSYESQIASTVNLLEFALSFLHEPHFLFTSSISVASYWDTRLGSVPESVLEITDSIEEHGNGYAGSKYVIEHILARINRTGVIKTTSLRVGQLSGSTQTGAWNPNEWVPSIIKSGIALSCLPTRDEES